MITINLLRGSRPADRTPLATSASVVPVACALILLLAAGGVGWWYWSLSRQALQLEGDLASARQEAEQLKSVIAEVAQFEKRQTQLRQRVDVIEELRGNQSVPVQLVDAVSRSLPDMLWLTHLKQTGADVVLEGRSTTLIALSDLVGNLAMLQVFERPVEIVDSQVEPAGTGASSSGVTADLIRFTVRARLAGMPVPVTAAAVKGTGR